MRKHKRQRILFLLLSAILLTCFFAPAQTLAASAQSNDNHTDTDDYCLRAFDVSVNLSEFSEKSLSQIKSEIQAASAFEFYYRSDWSTVTGGFNVNFSALEAAPTTSGYQITVTLDPVTMSEPSYISFRVFVIDDTYPVEYSFDSGTSGRALPEGVLSQLPANGSALSGTTITPSASFDTVRDGAGVWSFSGWSPASGTVESPSLSFSGEWLWSPLPVYTVTYQFTGDKAGKTLPDGVLSQLPASSSGVEGDVFTAGGSFSSVSAPGGIWRFRGWNANTQTILDANVVFTGTWHWHAYTAGAATRSPAPAPSDMPAVAVSVTPAPATAQPAATAATEEAPAIQVLEPIAQSAPVPAATQARFPLAQAAIVAGLSALVAAQSAAVASDLKVLKWYRAKKASRRTSA